MFHHDKGRGLIAALGYAQEGAHLELARVLFVQDLATHGVKLTGNLHGQVGQVGGCGIVGRAVDQVTGQASRLGHDLAHLGASFHGGYLGRIELDQGQAFRVGPVGILVLEFPVAVEAEDRAFDHSLGRLLQVNPTRPGAVDDAAKGLYPQVAGLSGGCSCGLADRLQREFLLGSQSNDDHARGRDRAARVKDGDLAALAAEIAVGHDFTDGAAQCLVHSAGGAPRPFGAFEQVDDDQFIFGGLDATGHHPNLHWDSPSALCLCPWYQGYQFLS